MIVPNYTTEKKDKSKYSANYTDDMTRDLSKEKTTCYECIFVGENEDVSKRRLCAKHFDAIAEVEGNGTCDDGRAWYKWYNRLYAHMSPIKDLLLARSGFRFKNR